MCVCACGFFSVYVCIAYCKCKHENVASAFLVNMEKLYTVGLSGKVCAYIWKYQLSNTQRHCTPTLLTKMSETSTVKASVFFFHFVEKVNLSGLHKFPVTARFVFVVTTNLSPERATIITNDASLIADTNQQLLLSTFTCRLSRLTERRSRFSWLAMNRGKQTVSLYIYILEHARHHQSAQCHVCGRDKGRLIGHQDEDIILFL